MKLILGLLMGICLIAFSGCVSTLDGRHHAGLPLTKDKVERRYERPPQDCWLAAKDVLKYLGTLTGEDTERSVLQANVDTRTVWVRVEQQDARITVVTIQARKKGGTGDTELAGYVSEQIAVRLATGNLSPASPGQ